MNLYCSIHMKDKLRKDKDMSVTISQLPIRQVNLIFTLITYHDPLCIQRSGANHTDNLYRNIHLRIECRLWSRNSLIDGRRGGLNSRRVRRTIITVIPKQDRACHTGRNEHIQEQVRMSLRRSMFIES